MLFDSFLEAGLVSPQVDQKGKMFSFFSFSCFRVIPRAECHRYPDSYLYNSHLSEVCYCSGVY